MSNKLVVLVGGRIHVGKSLFSKMMCEELGDAGLKVENMMLAQGVKDGCRDDFARLTEHLNALADKAEAAGEDELAEELRIRNDNWYENKTNITRILLQTYGTEIFRNRVDGEWWVKKLAERICKSSADVIFVTDFRFPNECEKLKPLLVDREVLTVSVERKSDASEQLSAHTSENALDGYPFDFRIDNSGTVADLADKCVWLRNKLVEKVGGVKNG